MYFLKDFLASQLSLMRQDDDDDLPVRAHRGKGAVAAPATGTSPDEPELTPGREVHDDDPCPMCDSTKHLLPEYAIFLSIKNGRAFVLVKQVCHYCLKTEFVRVQAGRMLGFEGLHVQVHHEFGGGHRVEGSCHVHPGFRGSRDPGR